MKKWNEWAPVPIRLVFGGALAYHGYPKVFTAAGHASFLHIMEQMGVPLPQVMSWVIGLLEFFGGLTLVLGAFVVTASVLIVIELSINIIVALLRGGFPPPLNPNEPLPGYASSFLFICGLLALAIGGAGGFSLTRMVVPKRSD
jgi:putative oxidoreductase